MNLPIEPPPPGWLVSQAGETVKIERAGGAPLLRTQVTSILGAGLFVIAFVVATRLRSSDGLLDAILGWPTLMVLLIAGLMIFLVLHARRNFGGDRRFVIEPGKLTVHARFGSSRETQAVERSRILRFLRSTEETPEDESDRTWWLDFEARGAGFETEEIYLGGFHDRDEAEWFAALFERWSGHRVKDVFTESEDEDLAEEAAEEETP
ncbi:MAG: hypothetical protein U5J83_01905 [Bryobacterales bacterium]|nr:hypothetical protein [Bryobacterales bacterium]